MRQLKPGFRLLSIKGIRFLGLLFLAAFFTLFLFQSCLKENYDFDKIAGLTWSPDIAFPLIDSRLTLADILKEVNTGDVLVEDSITKLLSVIYRSDIFSQTAGDLFALPDQSYDTTLVVNPPVAIPPGDSIKINLPIMLSFITTNGEELDSIVYTGASALRIDITGDMDHDASFVLNIPGLTKNGIQLSTRVDYQYGGSVPLNILKNVSLNGYTIRFNSAANGIHMLQGNMEVTAYGDANTNTGPYSFAISLDQVNLDYVTLYGYLGQQNIGLPSDTVDIDIFGSVISGTFSVDDPKVKINIRNSFGAPMSIDVQSLRGIGVNPPYDVVLSGPGLPNPLFINSPTVQQLGQEITTTVYLNKGNSNITDLLNIAPNRLMFTMDGLMNPSGNPSVNFVQPASGITVDVEVEMPLSGTAGGFILEDTIDFSLETVEQLETILFRVNLTNGFPIDVRMQVYLADSNYTFLDSLLQPMQLIIASGVAGPAPDYKVISPTNKVTDIILDNNRLAAVGDTKYLILRAGLNTADNGNTVVKFYSDYALDVKMGVQAKLKVVN